jgi:energy-coupling factor transporter ATP-binding protein EcfA2
LAGANDSGKTSLLRVLAGLSAPRLSTVRRPARCALVGEKVMLAGSVLPGVRLTVMRGLRGLPAADWRGAVREAGLEPSVLMLPAARLVDASARPAVFRRLARAQADRAR